MDDQSSYMQQLNAASSSAMEADEEIQGINTKNFREQVHERHVGDVVRSVALPIGLPLAAKGLSNLAVKAGLGAVVDDYAKGGVQQVIEGGVDRTVQSMSAPAATETAAEAAAPAAAPAAAAPDGAPNPAFDPTAADGDAVAAAADDAPAAAAGAAAGATEGGAEAGLGSALSASTAADWNPIGDIVTAGLGLATILAGVFGHGKIQRHPPTPQPQLNPSTQFGV